MNNSKKQSQTKDVLKFMKTHGSITSMQAIKHFRATRLASIICRLRRRGYDIETKMETGKNKYGTYEYGKYILKGEPDGE